MILMLDVNLILTSKKIKVKRNKKCGIWYKKGDKVVYAKGGTSQFSGKKNPSGGCHFDRRYENFLKNIS